MPYKRSIYHALSYLRASMVTRSLWPGYCCNQGRQTFGRMARGYRIMEEIRARGVDKDSDSLLVATARRGDTQAFQELFFRHEQRVLAVAQRITNNREDAEDVAQESFHKAFLHLDAFQEKSRFSTWLTRIVMNEAFMLLRRRRGVFEVLPETLDDGLKSAS